MVKIFLPHCHSVNPRVQKRFSSRQYNNEYILHKMDLQFSIFLYVVKLQVAPISPKTVSLIISLCVFFWYFYNSLIVKGLFYVPFLGTMCFKKAQNRNFFFLLSFMLMGHGIGGLVLKPFFINQKKKNPPPFSGCSRRLLLCTKLELQRCVHQETKVRFLVSWYTAAVGRVEQIIQCLIRGHVYIWFPSGHINYRKGKTGPSKSQFIYKKNKKRVFSFFRSLRFSCQHGAFKSVSIPKIFGLKKKRETRLVFFKITKTKHSQGTCMGPLVNRNKDERAPV